VLHAGGSRHSIWRRRNHLDSIHGRRARTIGFAQKQAPAAGGPTLMLCQGLRARASTPTSLPVRTNLRSAVPAADATRLPMHSRSIGGAAMDDHGVRVAHSRRERSVAFHAEGQRFDRDA